MKTSDYHFFKFESLGKNALNFKIYERKQDRMPKKNVNNK